MSTPTVNVFAGYYERFANFSTMSTLGLTEEFFLLDSTWFYWPQMPGQKLLR